MDICKELDIHRIFLDVPLADKDDILRFAAEAFVAGGIVSDADTFYDGLKEREDTMSTGIGKGIAIPHAASPDTKLPAILVIRLADPLDYDAIDGAPVKVVIALAAPEHDPDLHLRMLSSLAGLCQHPGFMTAVQSAQTPKALLKSLKTMEEEMRLP